MKLNEVPPILTTTVKALRSIDGTLVIVFGHSLDGKEENINYHSALMIPSEFADEFRRAIAKTSPNDVSLYLAEKSK